MVILAVWTFEDMWAWFTFFGFKAWWVSLFISFATPTELVVVFRFMQTITFDTFKSLNSAWQHSMFLFPTIFTLWNTKVHVSSSNSGNILSYIKVLIDKALGLAPTLGIPNVNPNDRHIWLWRNFNNSQFWSKNNIVKNLVLFDDILYISWRKIFL